MKNKSGWIDPDLLGAFEAERTDAHRLCTSEDGWVERFARDVLVSYKTNSARDRMMGELDEWSSATGFGVGRVFARFLPKRNEEREMPRLISGNTNEPLQTIVTERGLRFGVDFGAGYSVGLFVDQRENRTYLGQTAPRRLLNCFAYTCAFSVAAASTGTITTNVDLSKTSLRRGQDNFFLNNLPTDMHRFIADDVVAVLPRLARRGEKFDAIILDPPTFSRSHRGHVFHVERDFEKLLLSALEVAERDARILLSTNCSTLRERALEVMGRYCLKVTRRAGSFHRTPSLPDFPPGGGASTVWLILR